MKNLTEYVNTNIGTVGHLLTACRPEVHSPHGMLSLCACFRPGFTDVYNSDKIFGVSVGSVTVSFSESPELTGFYALGKTFDHDFETARPDVYEAMLGGDEAVLSFTANKNYGVIGYRITKEAPVYTVIRIKNLAEYKTGSGRLLIKTKENGSGTAYMHTGFDIGECEIISEKSGDDETLIVLRYNKNVTLPLAVTLVSFENLSESMDKDLAKKSFADVARECENAWNALLAKAVVTGDDENMKTVFYTAIYRACTRMRNVTVLGKYFGFDGKIHDADGVDFYTGDGIWDTYRGMHPLQLLLEPDVHEACIKSYLRMYEQSGWLPRFPGYAGNRPCMIGHHTVSILAESLEKNVDFDAELAYEAAYKNATVRTVLPWKDGEADELTRFYHQNGYLPALEEDEKETVAEVHSFENRQAVAVTIEQSYDYYCLSLIAKRLGKTDDAKLFEEKSKSYKQLWDKEIKFFRPKKADGSFIKEYDPMYCGGWGGRKYFAENNAYIYDFAAQHDIDGLTELFGGKAELENRLDRLFTTTYDGDIKGEFLAHLPDATGLVGQFCMGNEPSFHIPYLYNYCGAAYKTQRKIHELMRLWFTNSPLGICGDEDGGAMSAFAAFSCIGFYPVCPPSGRYDLGSPMFDKIELTLPNGKKLVIDSYGAGSNKKYITAATFNGKPLTRPYLTHGELMQGGELTLDMGIVPNKNLFA